MTFSLRLTDEDSKLIKRYAETKNITVSELIRSAVLEKIEDEIDIELYEKAMADHKKNPQAISFDEMMKQIND